MAFTRNNTRRTRNTAEPEASSNVETPSEMRSHESDMQQAPNVDTNMGTERASPSRLTRVQMERQLREIRRQCDMILREFTNLSSDDAHEIQPGPRNTHVPQPNHGPETTSVNSVAENATSVLGTARNRIPLWQQELRDPGMKGHPTRKNVEKFKGRSMKEFETFVTAATAFHASDITYFNEYDHRKIIEAVTHFDSEMQRRWYQHTRNMHTLPSWNYFLEWMQRQVTDPNKAFQDADKKYWEIIQLEHQTVQQFASYLQSIEGRLRHSYSEHHRKMHLYMKVLPAIRREFDKYADRIEDMSYDAVLHRLATAESNLPERQKRLKDKSNKRRWNEYSSSSTKDSQKDTEQKTSWCAYCKRKGHTIEKCFKRPKSNSTNSKNPKTDQADQQSQKDTKKA
ncbi:hypothetical protein ACJ73_09326 [Blastomyces percursus]|uniref:Uncharacterized protein n=1 Tax=Blastomyces percursus TaxID=1658174 RepID=A0A1J9Q9I3_9EURO|nr:hypothetical protein ACJ73_09326 [Blastomyces percursus]